MNDLNLDFMKNIRNIYVNHFSLYNMYTYVCYIHMCSIYVLLYVCMLICDSENYIYINISTLFKVFCFSFCNMKCDD